MQQNGPRDASITMDSTGTFNVFSCVSARSSRDPAVATAVGAASDFDGDFVVICLTLHARTKKSEPNFATDATNRLAPQEFINAYLTITRKDGDISNVSHLRFPTHRATVEKTSVLVDVLVTKVGNKSFTNKDML